MNIKFSSANNVPSHLQNPDFINDRFVTMFQETDKCKDKIEYYINIRFQTYSKLNLKLLDQITVMNAFKGIGSNATGMNIFPLKCLNYVEQLFYIT